MSANRAASSRARLKQHTDPSKQDFNLTLTRYGLERLLYRLSISEHAPNFLLKGALLFHLWCGQPHRPTRDADLLGFGPDDVPTLVDVFRSIASIAVDDGVVFDATSVTGSPIRKDAGYGGVRIDLRATLDGARLSLQIDIGFDDAVTPAALSIDYPTLLPDVPAPTLRAYPKAIATTLSRNRAGGMRACAVPSMKNSGRFTTVISRGPDAGEVAMSAPSATCRPAARSITARGKSAAKTPHPQPMRH
jgi:hypothetical protein